MKKVRKPGQTTVKMKGQATRSTSPNTNKMIRPKTKSDNNTDVEVYELDSMKLN